MTRRMALVDLQRSLARSIARPDAPNVPGRHGDASSSFELNDFIRSDREITASDRLWIYQHAYFARIHDVLREDFAILRSVVGDDAFHDLVKLYLMAHPPGSFSLRFVGERFPKFLDGPIVAPFASRWPFAADLAAFEWARVDLFDAPDTAILERRMLAGIRPEDWPSLRLVPAPAQRVLELSWPVQTLVSSGPDTGQNIEIRPAPTALLLFRRREVVFHRTIGELERQALARIAARADFEGVCACVSESIGDVEGPRYVLALLEQWIDEGLFAAVVETNGRDPTVP